MELKKAIAGLLAVVLLALAGCSGQKAATNEKKTEPAAQPEAKPAKVEYEKELTVYSGQGKDYVDAALEEFKKLYPDVTVNWVNPGGTEVIMKKLEEEKASPKADIFHGGSTVDYQEAKRRGLLQPHKYDTTLPQSIGFGGTAVPIVDKDGTYFRVWGFQFIGIGVNTKRLQDLKLPTPKSWADLTNPAYKGVVTAPMPQKSSTAFTTVLATYQALGKDQIWPWWDKVNGNVGQYSASSSNSYSLLSKGEFAILLAGNRHVWINKKEGFPVEFIFPEDGTMIFDYAAGVVKDAKHPVIAQLFMDFITGKEMQTRQTEGFVVPVRPGIQALNQDANLEVAMTKTKKVLIPDNGLAEQIRADVMKRFDVYTKR